MTEERKQAVERLRNKELCAYDDLSVYGQGVADAIDFMMEDERAESHVRFMLAYYQDFAEGEADDEEPSAEVESEFTLTQLPSH